MVVDQGPLSLQLIAQAKHLLKAMEDKRFDEIWDRTMTYAAKDLISTAVMPLYYSGEDDIDELLDLDVVKGLALGFQQDHEGQRFAFFDGFASSFEDHKWFLLDESDYMVVAIDGAALVVNGSQDKALFIPFIERHLGEFVVDWEALMAFSLTISSQNLFSVGTRALVYNHLDTAALFFGYSAKLLNAYQRLEALVLDQVLISRYVTQERQAELRVEITHAERAQKEVDAIRSSQYRPKPSLDMNSFLSHAIKGYDQIADIAPTETDLGKLSLMSDSDLRKAVAKLLCGVDRAEVRRESRKSHGPAELADMVVNLQFQERIYALCLPFKTGRETGLKKSVPESVVYQIWRPFMFLSAVVVVFVTARPCSQFLHQDIRQSIHRMGWPIAVIEHRELASLLMVNKLL